jgi:hypothetical protein
MIAVITLRSTPQLHLAAVRATRGLAQRLAQELGWDARVVDTRGRQPADAAAAVGAEIYVIGQYFGGAAPHIVGAAIKVATDQHLSEFAYSPTSLGGVPGHVSFSQLTGGTAGSIRTVATAKAPVTTAALSIPSGELISVAILTDIGSRTSQEGDTFPVITTEDYYYHGSLILPKGSPGYGMITHLKRAGSFHAGGELNFTVKRLVTPSRTDLLVETNGATADADKQTERNGNTFGQYLLWGVGMFAQRGNDILIKKGTTFHVSTLENATVPIAQINSLPAQLDPIAQLDATGQLPMTVVAQPQSDQTIPIPQAPVANNIPVASPPLQSSSNTSLFQAPNSWVRRQRLGGSDDMATLGFWLPPGDNSGGEWLSVVSQNVPTGMTPNEFATVTKSNLQHSIGEQNVQVFRAHPICNGSLNGWYAQSVTYVGIRQVIAEQTIGLIGTDGYVATYSRPQGSTENSEARKALDSLCPLRAS